MLEVSSSLHTLSGWDGKVEGGGAGTGKGDFLFRNGRRFFFQLLKQVLFGNEMAL